MNIGVAEIRNNFAELLNRVAYAGERVVLERRGKGVAALVSMDDLELLEKLEERFLYRAQLGAQQQQYGMQWPGAASQEGVEGMIAEARVSFWKYCMRAGMKQHNFDVAMSFQKLCSEAEKDWRAIATTDNSVSLLSE